MNAIDIIQIARSDPIIAPYFGGVFPANLVLNIRPSYPSGIIVNTDPQNKPGKHWVAFYFTVKGHGEFFDSYGHPPQYYHKEWDHWMKRYTVSRTFNKRKIQPVLSASCGLHCLFYLYHRCLGLSMKQVQKLYTRNKDLNDLIAEEDLEKHIRTDIVINYKDYIINQLCTGLA